MMEFLQRSDCNLSIKRTHHKLFMEYVPKTSYFKKNILRKKSMVDERLNKVVALQYTILNFFKKAELMQGLPVEVLKVLIYSHR